MAELVPMKVKNKTGKCTALEPEAVSKTNNALLKAVVKGHLWKRQPDEGKQEKCERAEHDS
jgi:site-specific DNA recombinase